MSATSLSIEPDDLELSPFNQRGGLGKAHQLFGEQLPNPSRLARLAETQSKTGSIFLHAGLHSNSLFSRLLLVEFIGL